ncbi:hypothetical protein ACRAWD_22830 [Caulobacter segnis]
MVHGSIQEYEDYYGSEPDWFCRAGRRAQLARTHSAGADRSRRRRACGPRRSRWWPRA